MEPTEDAGDAGVKQFRVRAELRGEAVAGEHGGSFAADGLAKRGVLAHERHRASPRRDAVKALGERHADHRAERVAGASRPPRLVKLGDQPPDLGRVEESCKLGRRRARWYLRVVHGTTLRGPDPRLLAQRGGHVFGSTKGNLPSASDGKPGLSECAYGEIKLLCLDLESAFGQGHADTTMGFPEGPRADQRDTL